MQRKPPENTREALKSYAVNNFEGTKGKWLSLNYRQNFLILGAIHQAAWSESKSQEDLDKTIYYFEEGLKLSPERAQFLFGLFELYRWANRNADAEKVIRKIAELWPSSVTEQPKTAN
ncbi:tetratricopeptide repeat protein [Candidatus Peregrinibacteria bacterium]|nr:tetratricopeptide repeat protein [Candidatus Peregrinibacteria bacterium]